jgi:hypothetical protein
MTADDPLDEETVARYAADDRLPEESAWIAIPELGVELRRWSDGTLHARRTDDEEGLLP